MTRAEVERHCVVPEIHNTVQPSALTSTLSRCYTHTHTSSNTKHATTLTICETTVADNESLYDINHVGISSEINAQLSSVDQTLEALGDKSRYLGEGNENTFYQNRKRIHRGVNGNETIKLRNKINESLANQMAFFNESTTTFPCLNGWSTNSQQSSLPPEHIFSPTRPKDI